MAGFFQNQPFTLIGIALILTSLIWNQKSDAVEHPMKIDSHNSRRATYFWNDDLISHFFWFNIGTGEHGSNKPTGLFYTETATLHNISLKHPINISGLKIRNVILTNAGSIYSNDDKHEMNLCPVKINTTGNPSIIQYLNFRGHLIVQWEIQPFLYHKYHYDEELKMQVHVLSNGIILFLYKKIPFGSLRNFRKKFDNFYKDDFGVIFSDKLPDGREVLLSSLFSFDEIDVVDNSAVVFNDLPFCPNYRTCENCTAAKIKMEDTGETIPCVWCPEIKRCSSKKDYLRDYWLGNDCKNHEIPNPLRCPKEKGPAEEAKKKTKEFVADEL
ncbi:Hypothetical predicted protein [Cloeon dipterum]|uniref:Alpha-carbonic anhydrase domain-containing protein n=1 Tax=Cloeon dipterum TaxID=197152 RepID=A0A8S1DQG6_9INSE|nr:Hypothetical predicted protein [Cloeon dipterum]